MAVSYEDTGKFCNRPSVTALLSLSKRTSDDVLYINPKTSSHEKFSETQCYAFASPAVSYEYKFFHTFSVD